MRISARAWIVPVAVALAAVPFAEPPAFYESCLYLVFRGSGRARLRVE